MRRVLRILILTDNNDNADEEVVDPKQTAAMTQKFLLPPTPDDVLINNKWKVVFSDICREEAQTCVACWENDGTYRSWRRRI